MIEYIYDTETQKKLNEIEEKINAILQRAETIVKNSPSMFTPKFHEELLKSIDPYNKELDDLISKAMPVKVKVIDENGNESFYVYKNK